MADIKLSEEEVTELSTIIQELYRVVDETRNFVDEKYQEIDTCIMKGDFVNECKKTV